jgi:glutathione peroxidase
VHEKYKDQGFAVIGFPCNQFGGQEPGSMEEIQAFAQEQYGVTFDIFDKLEVNGDRVAPLFEFLKSQCPGIMGTESVKWNFSE